MSESRPSAGLSAKILEDVFGTKARATLLRRLSRESQALTARQLGQLTGLNHRTVVEALEPLTRIGVVEKRHAGPSYLYSLARDSLIVQSIVVPAFEAELEVPSALRAEIVSMFASDAVSVVLFGSLARGEEEPGSDADVLVVVADGRRCAEVEERALEAGHAFFRRFGRPLSVHCVAVSDVRAGGMAFLSEAKHEGETLFGKPLMQLEDPNA